MSVQEPPAPGRTPRDRQREQHGAYTENTKHIRDSLLTPSRHPARHKRSSTQHRHRHARHCPCLEDTAVKLSSLCYASGTVKERVRHTRPTLRWRRASRHILQPRDAAAGSPFTTVGAGCHPSADHSLTRTSPRGARRTRRHLLVKSTSITCSLERVGFNAVPHHRRPLERGDLGVSAGSSFTTARPSESSMIWYRGPVLHQATAGCRHRQHELAFATSSRVYNEFVQN